jgi:hypothetical protein
MYYVEEMGGCGADVSLTIHWNDARILVNLKSSALNASTPPIENSFIERYNAACDAEDGQEADALSDDILDAICEVGSALFDQLAPPSPTDASSSPDLHTLLFPKEYTFCFQTLNGKAELIRDDSHATHDEAALDPFGQPFHLKVHEDCKLPRISTKNIRVLERLMDRGYITRVAVDGQEMCSKAGDSKGQDAAQRELDCLWKITTAHNATNLRVPKLLGLVETPDDKRVVGYLIEYIPLPDAWELSTLGRIDTISAITEDRRKKWASQVHEMVQLLHQIGITWGDGKASNVLVHRDTDDAWIIDFGGGWTDGWLNEELAGTVEGDQVAVKKISDFLEV